MTTLIRESGVTGNLVHDAHIAALSIEHGVSELLTGDRDFSRFPIRVTNPPASAPAGPAAFIAAGLPANVGSALGGGDAAEPAGGTPALRCQCATARRRAGSGGSG